MGSEDDLHLQRPRGNTRSGSVAGTYVFKLLSSSSDRDIVQVFNKNEKHLYGTFLAVPDYRIKAASKPIITFNERPAGSPEAVRAWFYPGQNYGHDFVYPKPKAVELAKANQTPVASMPAELASNTTTPVSAVEEPPVTAMKGAPIKAQKPTEEEVEIAEVFAVPDSGSTGSLPATASNVPLIGMAGLVMVAGGLILRRNSAKLRQG